MLLEFGFRNSAIIELEALRYLDLRKIDQKKLIINQLKEAVNSK